MLILNRSNSFIYSNPDLSVGKESTCSAGDPSSIPGLGISAGEGIGYPLQYSWTSLVAQLVKNLPAMRETWVWSLGWEDLEKGKAIHSSILAWRIPWIAWNLCPWGHKELDTTKRLSLSCSNTDDLFFVFFHFYFILFFFSGFCHTLTWISHGYTCIPHPDPPSHLPLHLIPLGLPSAPGLRLVSCIWPGLVICFTLDNIHVSMLFSWNIPPSPSPTESKSLFYISVSLFLFCI